MGIIKKQLDELYIRKADEISEFQYRCPFEYLPNELKFDVFKEAIEIVHDDLARMNIGWE